MRWSSKSITLSNAQRFFDAIHARWGCATVGAEAPQILAYSANEIGRAASNHSTGLSTPVPRQPP
jgi:hypothetical protein